jgi:hypothetical protein
VRAAAKLTLRSDGNPRRQCKSRVVGYIHPLFILKIKTRRANLRLE